MSLMAVAITLSRLSELGRPRLRGGSLDLFATDFMELHL
jgi:hypothetical protein